MAIKTDQGHRLAEYADSVTLRRTFIVSYFRQQKSRTHRKSLSVARPSSLRRPAAFCPPFTEGLALSSGQPHRIKFTINKLSLTNAMSSVRHDALAHLACRITISIADFMERRKPWQRSSGKETCRPPWPFLRAPISRSSSTSGSKGDWAAKP